MLMSDAVAMVLIVIRHALPNQFAGFGAWLVIAVHELPQPNAPQPDPLALPQNRNHFLRDVAPPRSAVARQCLDRASALPARQA